MAQEINGQVPIVAPLVGEVAYYVKPTAAGKDSANISLGIFETTLGDPATRNKVDSPLPLAIYVPAYSMVGAKVMSSTDGEDTITMTLGYETL